MVCVKDIKVSMIGGWVIVTALFLAALKFWPAWSDEVLKKAFMLLFGYVSIMFGLTWKYMWKLTRKQET